MSIGYASKTKVDVAKTRAEIDALLTKHGASSVAILNDEDKARAAIAFVIKGARFRVELPLPMAADVRLDQHKAPSGRWWASTEQRENYRADALAQLRRERWRAVLLLLKSKLEIVRLGMTSLEREFLAYMVLPGGDTVHKIIAEAIRQGLGPGDLPSRLLSAGSST